MQLLLLLYDNIQYIWPESWIHFPFLIFPSLILYIEIDTVGGKPTDTTVLLGLAMLKEELRPKALHRKNTNSRPHFPLPFPLSQLISHWAPQILVCWILLVKGGVVAVIMKKDINVLGLFRNYKSTKRGTAEGIIEEVKKTYQTWEYPFPSAHRNAPLQCARHWCMYRSCCPW